MRFLKICLIILTTLFALIIIVPTIIFVVMVLNNFFEKGRYSYIPQNIETDNYNHFSTYCNNLILTADASYKITYNFNMDVHSTTPNGRKWLFNSEYCPSLQKYEDCLYYADKGFCEYNLRTKEKRSLLNYETLRPDQYLIINGCAYIVFGREYWGDFQHNRLVSLKIDTLEVSDIAENVFSIGVSDGKLFYITCQKNKYSIYKFDSSPELISELNLEECVQKSVNYTSDYVIFEQADSNGHIFILYNLNDKTFKILSIDMNVSCAIAYENYMFFVEYTHEGKEGLQESEVHRLCLETGQYQKVCSVHGYAYLKVFSDDSVYVYTDDKPFVRKYSLDGTYEDVYKKRTIF